MLRSALFLLDSISSSSLYVLMPEYKGLKWVPELPL